MSCCVNVVNNFVAFPRSASPLLKKKLAPGCLFCLKDKATVRDMVDFPVPAIPFNQKMQLPCGDAAHVAICCWRSVLVPSRHSSSC